MALYLQADAAGETRRLYGGGDDAAVLGFGVRTFRGTEVDELFWWRCNNKPGGLQRRKSGSKPEAGAAGEDMDDSTVGEGMRQCVVTVGALRGPLVDDSFGGGATTTRAVISYFQW